jgi:hypothetical protein
MADPKNYKVILLGKIIEGFDAKKVEEKLISIFEKNSKQIKKLFKKPQPTVIRKNLTQDAAFRYKTGLEALGALCLIQDEEDTAAQIKGKTTSSERKSSSVTSGESLSFVKNEENVLVLGDGTVLVTEIKMSFGSLVIFLVKWMLASIPALLILAAIGQLFVYLMNFLM